MSLSLKLFFFFEGLRLLPLFLRLLLLLTSPQSRLLPRPAFSFPFLFFRASPSLWFTSSFSSAVLSLSSNSLLRRLSLVQLTSGCFSFPLPSSPSFSPLSRTTLLWFLFISFSLFFLWFLNCLSELSLSSGLRPKLAPLSLLSLSSSPILWFTLSSSSRSFSLSARALQLVSLLGLSSSRVLLSHALALSFIQNQSLREKESLPTFSFACEIHLRFSFASDLP